MNISVWTRNYESSHGKMPKGRGFWAFEIPVYARKETEVFWAKGPCTYSEAKKQALLRAFEVGADHIIVGS